MDVAKGISILLLVAFHICGQIFHSKPLWFRTLSYRGVPAFFLASGLGLTYSIINNGEIKLSLRTWVSWIRRRLVRIFPLYWLILFITLVVYVSGLPLLRVVPDSSAPWADFVIHVFMLHVYIDRSYFSINVAWWFVGVIFYFYLIFPVLFKLLRRPGVGTVIFVLMIAGILIARAAVPDKSQVITSLMFFIIGIYMAFLRSRSRVGKRPAFFVLAFFISAFISVIMLHATVSPLDTLRLPYNMHVVLFSISFVAALYMFSINVIFLSKWRPIDCFGKTMSWFGTHAYAIFLIHWALIFPIISNIPNRFAGIACYLIILSVVSYILTRLDRMMCQLVMRRRSSNMQESLR